MKMCVLVPTRGRPSNFERLADAFIQTKTEATLVAVISKDDPKAGEYSSRYYRLYVDNTTGGCVKSISEGIKEFLKSDMYGHYDFFAFMGDDNLPKTQNWDRLLMQPIIGKTGITYCNDLYQGENLPGNPCISRDIVEALTKYGWPEFIHLYIDNFIKELGIAINSLYYNPDIIIEHLHPFIGKAEMDEQYARVNSPERYMNDKIALEKYLNSQTFADLVNELKS